MRPRSFPYLLIALVLLAYAPLFSAEFVRWDDPFTLHQNPRLNPPTSAGLAAYWREWKTGEYGLYIPVTYTVWMGLAAIARVHFADPLGIALNPWVFHTANILVHVGSTLLVYRILVRLLRAPLAALIGAAVFAVHPLQVEPVAWASGMKDLLSGMLVLAAVHQYLQWADAPPGRGQWRYATALLLAVLAMLAKPSAVIIGPLCFVLDTLLLRRSWRDAWMGTLPMLAIALPVAVVARRVQDVSAVEPVVFWKRPFIAGDALLFYLRKLILPLRLAIDYGRTPQLVLSRPATYFAALVPLGLAIVLLRWAWLGRRREIVAAGAIFTLALLPVLGFSTFQFQQYSTVADHYVYLSMFGVAIAVAWLVSRWPRRGIHWGAAAIILTLAACSFAQARRWHDDFVLFPHVLSVNPGSWAANNNFAAAYEVEASLQPTYAAAAEQRGDLAAARQHRENRITFLQRAAEHYHRAAELKADYPIALEGFARVSRELGRPERAIEPMRKALELRLAQTPRSNEALLNRLLLLASDLNTLGRHEEAKQYIHQGLDIEPTYPPLLRELRIASAASRPATGVTP